MWFWGTTVLVAFTMLVVFTVDSTLLLYVRYVLGGIFILFLPGFMLISVLYPRGREIDELERLALSIGLSLAIVPLVGLIAKLYSMGNNFNANYDFFGIFFGSIGVWCACKKISILQDGFKVITAEL